MRISDWSSDVCSSDLTSGRPLAGRAGRRRWRSRRASGLLVFAQQRLHSGDLAAKADPREAQALEVLERDRLALHHLAGRDPRDASLEQDRIEARARRAVDRTGRPGVGVNRLEDSLLRTPTPALQFRSEEHTSELQSLMRLSY